MWSASHSKGTDHDGLDTEDRTLYLIGRPRLRDLLRFASHAVTPPNESALADAWQTAHELVRRLEVEQADLADNPPIRKLGPEYEPLLIELLGDPLVQNGFNTVPTDVAMVELDRLQFPERRLRGEAPDPQQRKPSRLRTPQARRHSCPMHHPACRFARRSGGRGRLRGPEESRSLLEASAAPMLKDYFDPKLHLVMPVYRRVRQITVGFEVEENSVPGL
jgi:hypothetical protein